MTYWTYLGTLFLELGALYQGQADTFDCSEDGDGWPKRIGFFHPVVGGVLLKHQGRKV